LYGAAQSLIVVSCRVKDYRNKECFSQILFCLTMELAAIIQVFEDPSSKSNENDFLAQKDKLADRAEKIIRHGFKILNNMRNGLGIRTKRILLVYILKGTFITSQNTNYCHVILDDIVEYLKEESTDFLLPQLISAVLSGFSSDQFPQLKDFIITLLKQSIETSISDDKSPKQELMPACYSLIEELILKFDSVAHNEKEEIVRVIGRVVQYVCLAFNVDNDNAIGSFKTSTDMYAVDDYESNPFKKYVRVLTVILWNKSIKIEFKTGYKSIASINSQIKMKEFAKMLAKILPQNCEVSKAIAENEIDCDVK